MEPISLVRAFPLPTEIGTQGGSGRRLVLTLPLHFDEDFLGRLD